MQKKLPSEKLYIVHDNTSQSGSESTTYDIIWGTRQNVPHLVKQEINKQKSRNW